MINYLIGDATEPQVDGKCVIMHICNNLGAWGAGFVIALSDKWDEPESMYRSLPEYPLGDVQLVQVDEDTYVANMIAQDGFPRAEKPVAVDYDALRACLGALANLPEEFTFHAPRIGCGIGGGSWEEVESIINETLGEAQVYIYDLAPRG
jgi:O-acetyl-ADP-ribose deacetylase (regulator of RNase III)